MNLPIAERELRVAARSARVYRGRVVVGVVFSAITLWMLWVSRQMFAKQAVEIAFGILSTFTLMMCMFACNTTADAISSEKRGGTLGFLFLTDLKGADVVFGKLAATGLMSMYGLLAIIPVMSMPVLMGGISGTSLLRTAVTLANTLFFSLSMGLWISARSWEQKKANAAAVWTAVSMLWLLPGLAELLEQKLRWPAGAMALRVFSPAYQIKWAGPFGAGLLRSHYWMSVGLLHGLGWLALWRTCVIVPREWQDRPASPWRGRIRDGWDQFWMGSRAGRESFRRRLVDLNPVHWLSARNQFGPIGVWMMLGFILLVWTAMWIWITVVSRGKGPPFWGVGIPMVFVTMIGLRARTCGLAAEVLARDRLSGALELLLSTSLSLQEVSRGIWMTVRRFILGPAIVTMVAGGIIFMCVLTKLTTDSANSQFGSGSPRELVTAWIMFIGLSVLFVSDLVAGVWTGLWMSCLTRVPNGAGGMAMLRLLLLPWVMFFGTISLMSYFGVRSFFNDFSNVFSLWFLFCFANSLFWKRHSKRKFFEGVRLAASERFLPPEAAGRFWWMPWRSKALNVA